MARALAVASRLIASLSPLALLFGPIFQKEVRVTGRRRFTYVARTLYVLLLLSVVSIAFVSLLVDDGAVSASQRMQAIQSLAPGVGLAVAWFQFIAMALMAPVLTAGAIADERRAGTLSALLTTPMTSGQIILGKLTSRLLLMGILAILGVPVLLAVRVFGGLTAEFVAGTTCVALSTAFLGASLGLLYSTWHRQGVYAILFGILTLGLFQLGPLLLGLIILAPWNGSRGEELLAYMIPTASPVVMGLLSADQSGATGIPFDTTIAWTINVVYNFAVGALVCLAATGSLRSLMRKAEGPPAPRSKRSAKKQAALGAPAPTEPIAQDQPTTPQDDDGRVVHGESRTVGDSPIAWREVRIGSFKNTRSLITCLGVPAAFLVFLYVRFGLDEGGVHGTVGVITALSVLLQGAILTTAGIAGEREGRTWNVLLTTPLSPMEIVLGKFIGSVRRQWVPFAAIGAHLIISVLSGFISIRAVPQLAMVLAPPMLFLSSTGLFFSLLFRKATSAAVGNLALALVLWVGSWVSLGVLSVTFGFEPDPAAEFLYATNPVPMTFSVLEHNFGAQGWGSSVAGSSLEIGDGRIGAGRAWFVLLVVQAGYLILTAGTLVASWKLFRVFYARVAG